LFTSKRIQSHPPCLGFTTNPKHNFSLSTQVPSFEISQRNKKQYVCRVVLPFDVVRCDDVRVRIALQEKSDFGVH